MKHIRFLSVLFLLLTLAACECRKYRCAGFTNFENWLPEPGEVQFRNAATASTLSLIVTRTTFSQPYGEEGTVISFSCNQNDCQANGGVAGISQPSALAGELELNISIENTYFRNAWQTSTLTYTFAGMKGSFAIHPELQPARLLEDADWEADSLKNVTDGLSIYPRVLIQTRKNAAADEVAKIYWFRGLGLLGFVLGDGTTFWRQ